MMHSKLFNSIRSWYNSGYWNEAMVKNAVKKGKLTEAEFKEITGADYEANNG
ncbi:MAG: XkdX family protein [Lachnospiraceae bacterium]|nr:XkdX family protein [Lachnospiraceae bacterium]